MSEEVLEPVESTPESQALKDQACAASILVGCNAAMRTFKIHSADNAAIERPLQALISNVESLVKSRGKVVIAQVEGVFYLGDSRLRLGGSHQGIADQLAKELAIRNIGGLTFLDVPTKEQLIRFFTVLNEQSHGDVSAETIRAAIRAEGITSINVSKPLKALTEGQEKKSSTQRASDAYCAAIEHAATMYQDRTPDEVAKNPRPGNVRSQRIVQEIVDVADGDPAVILSLAGLRGAGDDEAEHSIAVAMLSIALGKKLGLSKTLLADLGLAAVYHDQGLQLLPPEEHGDYDKHPILAIRALLGRTDADPRLLRQVVVAFEHHIDTTCQGGHPKLRFKRRLHPFSQVVRLANDFDGLTRGRHGGRELDVQEAVRHMMAGSGTLYHAGLLQMFVELVGDVHEPGATPSPELAVLEPVDPGLPVLEPIAPADAVAPLDQQAAPAAALAASAKDPKKVLGALKLKRIKRGQERRGT